jgi:hypothetical protein
MVGTVPALGALAYKDKSRFTADLIVAKSGTRDYSTIQDAISGANDGDKIHIKKGTYDDEGVITLNGLSDLQIVGSGMRTILSGTTKLYGTSSSVSNLILKDLYFTPDSDVLAIDLSGAVNPQFENLIINGAREGIFLDEIIDGIIHKCKIYNCQREGIDLQWGYKKFIVSHCWVYNNSQRGAGLHDGIYIDGAEEVIITNNYAFDNQGTKKQRYGIQTAGGMDYSLITNNHCRRNQHATYDIVYEGANSKVCDNIGRYVAQGCD